MIIKNEVVHDKQKILLHQQSAYSMYTKKNQKLNMVTKGVHKTLFALTICTQHIHEKRSPKDSLSQSSPFLSNLQSDPKNILVLLLQSGDGLEQLCQLHFTVFHHLHANFFVTCQGD